MSRLSIITINYNNAEGLQKTIESVLSQTSKEIEYIVIDGGSTDGSLEIIKGFADRITYWVSEPDLGIYNAMNKGILVSTGEYCQFLNSGDYLLSSNVTERMLHEMPDCAIVYGNEVRCVDSKYKVERSYAGRQITFLDLYRSTIFHSSAYIKRALFTKYGLYDEALKIVSDWKFYVISVGLNNEKIAYKDIDVVLFDLNGISSTNKDLDKNERKVVLNQVLPKTILLDYEHFATDGVIVKRLKENKFCWWFMLNTYRVMVRLDKLFKN